MNIMMLKDILGSNIPSRWSKTSFISHIQHKKYEHIVESANNANYLKQMHRS